MTSRASQQMDMNSTLLNAMKDLLHAEFEDFRREMREIYRAELDKLNNDIQGLCNRIEQLQGLLNKSQPQASPFLEEDIIEELEDRERRAPNLIIYNMDEGEDVGCNDVDLANEIIRKINPGNTPQINKILRLGQGHSRPLRVSLPSKQEALFIFRNKYRYAGLIKISQDQTLKQKKHLHELQSQLKSLIDAGETNNTIRYKNCEH